MKTSFLASLAFAAVLVPSLASAASTLRYDPSAGNNDPRFVDSFFDAGSANAAAAKADAARYAEAEQAAKSGAVIGTHGSTGAQVIISYDPSADDRDPQFASQVIVENSANAAAAKADAARYAEAEQGLNSGAVVGTHGSTGAKVVLSYDPSAGNNDPRFVNTVVLGN